MQIRRPSPWRAVEHVGDLRRRDVGVTEQILDDAQVRAICNRWLAKA